MKKFLFQSLFLTALLVLGATGAFADTFTLWSGTPAAVKVDGQTNQYSIDLSGKFANYETITSLTFGYTGSNARANSFNDASWIVGSEIKIVADEQDLITTGEKDILVAATSHEISITTEQAETLKSATSVTIVFKNLNLGKIELTGTEKKTEPEPIPGPEADTSLQDGTYFVLNVGTKNYLAAGADWGTHAVVNAAGLDFGVALADGKYTFDSKVANGNNHFLNGEYTDGESFAWTLVKVSDGVFNIYNGEKYLTAGDNNVVTLGDDATAAAAQWQFRTLADRLKDLEAATAENGVDATFLIQDANFGRNDTRVSAWTVSADCTNKNLAGGDNTNMCAESYHSPFTISQLLSNAPAGKYTMTAQGFYRQDDNANEAAPVFFANENTAEVPVKTGTENSMSDASASFTAGQYTIEPIKVTVAAAGGLTIGVKNNGNTHQWVIWDNFRLTYLGNDIDIEELVESFEEALKNANEDLKDESAEVVTGEERTALEAAIKAYENVDKTNAEALTAAIAALNAAKNAFEAAKGAYQALADAKEAIDLDAYKYASEEKKAAVETAKAAEATNSEDATAKAAALKKAYRQYAESSALLEGVEGAEVLTETIANPAAEEAIAEPWAVVLGEGSGGALNILDGEPWTDGEDNATHKYFDGGNWGESAWDVALEQEITLPAGKYQLTVKSRASAELSSFNVFAGETKAEMQHIGALGGLFDRGWNDASVEFELAEEGAIKIGVQGVTSTVHNWMSFSDFRLAAFTTTENGIISVKTNKFQNNKYYNLNGQEVIAPTKGLYIINGKKVVIK